MTNLIITDITAGLIITKSLYMRQYGYITNGYIINGISVMREKITKTTNVRESRACGIERG